MSIVLSNNTYNRFDRAADDVNSLLNVDKGGKGAQPFKGSKVQRLARLTIETTVANGGLTWQAEEVYIDELGAVVVKPNGFAWTDDNPVFTLNAATAQAVMMVSQSGRPAVDPDPAKRYWFGNPGGGGGGTTIEWVKIKTKIDQKNYTADVYEYPGDPNPPTALDVPVYFYNVNYGEIPINNYYQSQIVGATYYAYAPTWGG